MRVTVVELAPVDSQVKLLSHEIAVVAFHLMSEKRFGRPSLVWRSSPQGWRIVHLHPSNLKSAVIHLEGNSPTKSSRYDLLVILLERNDGQNS